MERRIDRQTEREEERPGIGREKNMKENAKKTKTQDYKSKRIV